VSEAGTHAASRRHHNRFKFDLEGYTTTERVIGFAERYGQRPFSDFENVLDWGVGRGRMGRFMSTRATSFYGIDIDQDNVGWCAKNLKGSFHHVGLYPPTPLPSSNFDLIYGISIFTHLSEDTVEKWIAELRRLTKQGGMSS
jgi:cyclopropane fatty-acyl-phospholipid synthase-like methyltransferase